MAGVWAHNTCEEFTRLHGRLKRLRGRIPQLRGLDGDALEERIGDLARDIQSGRSLFVPGVVLSGTGNSKGILRGRMQTRFVDQEVERGVSREKAKERFRKLNKHYQAHHLIPAAVAERSALLRRLGFDTNEFANGIMLPNRPGFRRARDLAAHNGAHPNYDLAVNDALDMIDDLARRIHGDAWAVSKVKDLRKVLYDELSNSASDVNKLYNRKPGEWFDLISERLELSP